MSKANLPRCPECGAASNVEREIMEDWAKSDAATQLRCPTCGEISDVDDWLHGCDREGVEEA